MRRILLALTVLSGGVLAADGEAKHSVSLDAKVVRSGASTDRFENAFIDRMSAIRSRKTIVFQRQKNGVMDLEISVRNFAKTPDVVKVDWLFFAQELGSSSILALSHGAEDLVLKPGGAASVQASAGKAISIESKRWEIDRVEVENKRLEAPVSHERAKIGTKIVGWIARVTADGTVLAYKVSSPRFECYAQGDQRHELIETSAGKIGRFDQ